MGQRCNVATLQRCKDTKLQICNVAKLQSCNIAKMQRCKVVKLQRCKDAKMQRCKVAVAKLQSCKVAKVQSFKIAKWQSCKVAKLTTWVRTKEGTGELLELLSQLKIRKTKNDLHATKRILYDAGHQSDARWLLQRVSKFKSLTRQRSKLRRVHPTKI